MAVSVMKVAIGVVIVLLLILVVRWLMGNNTKLVGLNDAKKVTKIDSSSLAQNNASNYAFL
jgi:hypothetical protein